MVKNHLYTYYNIDEVNKFWYLSLFIFLRVYDPETRKIVQKNLGHSDSVRCIIHIPERSQVLYKTQCSLLFCLLVCRRSSYFS